MRLDELYDQLMRELRNQRNWLTSAESSLVSQPLHAAEEANQLRDQLAQQKVHTFLLQLNLFSLLCGFRSEFICTEEKGILVVNKAHKQALNDGSTQLTLNKILSRGRLFSVNQPDSNGHSIC